MKKKLKESLISSFQMWHDLFKLFVKKLNETFKLQKEFIKTELDYDEVDYYKYKEKKMNGYRLSKMTFSVLLLVMLRIVKQWKKKLDFRWKIVCQLQVKDGNISIVCVMKMMNLYTLIKTNTWDILLDRVLNEDTYVALTNNMDLKFVMNS